MSLRIRFKSAQRVGITAGAAAACAAFAVSAQAAAPVNLATASPFVVLAGSTATNTGPSVLNGDLGVSPGTSLVGFASPAVVNGATHVNDAVAGLAQSDLTTAYNVAAGEPTTADLTGQDLGGKMLNPGVYSFASSAQLTGTVTLNAGGDPNAQFVFQVGTALTTASASAVVLVNGASPCNVFWQVGSSATLGSTTAFQGNVMALQSVSLDAGATVMGRVLASTGAVTLIDNVVDNSMCTSGTTTPPGTTPPPGATTPTGTTPPVTTTPPPATTTPPALRPPSRLTLPTRKGNATLRRTPGTLTACSAGYSATVKGRLIKRVVFRLDGTQVGSRVTSPFRVSVHPAVGMHRVTARVSFKDATRAKTLTLGYHACAAAVGHTHNPKPTPKPAPKPAPTPAPQPGPSPFTG